MTYPIRPLMAVLAEIPDVRQKQGRRHSLAALLGLVFAATFCGYRSYSAMAEWGQDEGRELVQALGITHPDGPSAATLHRVLRHLDMEALTRLVSAWTAEVLAVLDAQEHPDRGVAIDGKTLRGSAGQGAARAHVLSALSHRMGLPLGQVTSPGKGREQAALTAILAGLLIEGRIVTVDALHTHRTVARTIVQQKGDYVMIVKANQPHLYDEIQTLFRQPEMVRETFATTHTVDAGHGRIETRRLTASTALCGYTAWPGLAQVFEIERTTIQKKSGRQRSETVYGLTSLSPTQANPSRLLRLVRHHWHIENKNHWVRDVTLDEDRSQVRSGVIPELMAFVRSTTIAVLRLTGARNIASAHRHYARHPWSALALLGVSRQ